MGEKLFYLWIIVVWAPVALLGLDPATPLDKYIFHTWTTRDGLPQNTIYSIAQDEVGYMWLGTDQGLVRFDGFRFVTYGKEIDSGLTNNTITALYVSQDRKLWIGKQGRGVSQYVSGDNKFLLLQDTQGNPPFGRYINAIIEDNQKSLWFATTGAGVIRYKDNTFSAIQREQGLSDNITTCLLIDHRGKLWIGTEKGLNYLDMTSPKISVYTTEDGLTGDHIRTLFIDSQRYLWIGTTTGLSFIRLREKDLQVRSFHNMTVKDGLSGNGIRSILEDRNGNIWIATNQG